MQNSSSKSILVVDSDLAYLKQVQADPAAELISPMPVGSGKEAQLLLADKTKSFVGVIVDPAVSYPGGISVIRSAKIHRPGVPVLMIFEGESPLTEDMAKRLGIKASFQKPVEYGKLVGLIAPNMISFSKPDGGVAGNVISVGLDTAFDVKDDAFSPIRAEDFLCGSNSFFDVYVRLGHGKYVKILQANESFPPERLLGYLKKGVEYFYLEKKSQGQYLAFCDKVSTAIVQAGGKNVDESVKAKAVMTYGEEALKFLNQNGVDSGNIKFAQGFVKNVESFTEKLKFSKDSDVGRYLDLFHNRDHGTVTTMISGLLGREFGFSGEKIIQILGLASFLHDVGLSKLPPHLKEDEISKMSEADLNEFKRHPTLGAEILREVHGVDPIVAQAVEQHHERRTRKGFPKQLGPGAINKLAELIGLSDEFANFMKQPTTKKPQELLHEVEKTIFNGFSWDVTDAFKKIFFPKI